MNQLNSDEVSAVKNLIASINLIRRWDKKTEELQLQQLLFLLRVAEGAPSTSDVISQSQLKERDGMAKQIVSRGLDFWREQGFLADEPDEHDRRYKNIRLKDDGVAELKKLLSTLTKHNVNLD